MQSKNSIRMLSLYIILLQQLELERQMRGRTFPLEEIETTSSSFYEDEEWSIP